LSDPALLEEIIASGKADVVEMARGLICDPELPNKARQGREDDIDRCIRCFTCFSTLLTHGQIVCALNPEIADESEQKFARPAARPHRVLVAGGGVAGMQAALTCARRGHDVVLCEKSRELGGALLCEENVPFKRHLAGYLKRQADRVERSGVKIMLGSQVTAEMAGSFEPDVIIAAVGAVPATPDIPGIGGGNVIEAREAYASPDRANGRIVILGGGLVGAELAIYLGSLGKDVTVVEMLPFCNVGDNILHGQAIGIELARAGVKTAFGTRIEEITADGVRGASNAGTVFFGADTVVRALGLKPLSGVADELRFCAPVFHQIGDCLAPKNIYEAVRTAHQIALDIGER
jgi:pyruvate/2-oxoglutarate dehydrogenase complex dihydrolipoamide dehydrogenase (E3) component